MYHIYLVLIILLYPSVDIDITYIFFFVLISLMQCFYNPIIVCKIMLNVEKTSFLWLNYKLCSDTWMLNDLESKLKILSFRPCQTIIFPGFRSHPHINFCQQEELKSCIFMLYFIFFVARSRGNNITLVDWYLLMIYLQLQIKFL